jgi:hypothetical protein
VSGIIVCQGVEDSLYRNTLPDPAGPISILLTIFPLSSNITGCSGGTVARNI